MEHTIYEAAGGYDALHRLAHAWHERCLADPVASHPFGHPGQHPQHLERLAAYWAEALGGPRDYTATMGEESHVLRLHAGNGEHRELDERAIGCFVAALDDAGLPDDERLRTALTDYFRWGTARMAAHPDSPESVPAGESLPHWSWDGPVA
ncbi:group II truncated hemoglobin [Nocardioides sp. MAHUQ-72]|uniref:group II truncated hemoglobin n=1 Tax=unclassified Nocardioides TaxID=2615069 RepID=UPI00360C3D82